MRSRETSLRVRAVVQCVTHGVWAAAIAGEVCLVSARDGDAVASGSGSEGARLMSPEVAAESIVVNEIMYAPRAGEPEWVEITNVGGLPVNIEGWVVADASGGRSGPFPPVVVPAGGTVVVTRDLPLFTLARGEPHCAAIAPRSMPLLNNAGDAVVIRSAAGIACDSVVYDPHWGGASGRSLERRNPRSPSDGKNWGECTDSSGATPCAPNSIAVLPVDLCLCLKAVYRVPYGALASLDGILKNSGLEPIQDVEVRWFIDEDRDAVPEGEEEVAFRREATSLLPGDSLTVTGVWTGARAGIHQLIVQAEVAGDGRPENNRAVAALLVGQAPGAVVINEIMYQPLLGEPEYIELAAADTALSLDGWALQLGLREDGTPEKSFAIGGSGGQRTTFVVVASDSSILLRFSGLRDAAPRAGLVTTRSALGLKNTGEVIRLIDPTGGMVDGVSYAPDWHDPAFTDVGGRSLEKIHPHLDGSTRESWSTCVAPEGGTPGLPNSIVTPAGTVEPTLHAAPNPFSPDNDGQEDHTVVSYRLAADGGYTTIRIFDRSGRMIRTLMERERGGFQGETVWDGRDDLSRRVRMGMYILYLEAFDRSGAAVGTAKTVVAVGGRL